MTTPSPFDQLTQRIAAGERLSAGEIRNLAAAHDILPLGMLADALKRRLHGTRVTFLRVSTTPFDGAVAPTAAPAARELRLTGAPANLTAAVQAVAAARSVAGARTLAAFRWNDVERVAGDDLTGALEQLRAAGLDAIAELPLDAAADAAAAALDHLTIAGFRQARLTIDKGTGADRVALLLHAGELRDRFAIVKAFNPLPLALDAFRPTTGYEDVKTVALARLAAPMIPAIQVDWLRYGPKLAQVALSFGADDIDGVSGSDEAPDGRRRAPLEEIRRNIEAAGFEPVERDGRFDILSGSASTRPQGA
jgi:aminodeoxyfutalosine synthase